MNTIKFNNKKFITTGNESGLSTNETVFHYFQKGNLITGKYSGGAIVDGQIVGKLLENNKLELLFQCLTYTSELKSGQSWGILSKTENGKIELSFDWNWLNGDKSGCKSYYKEFVTK